MWPTFFIMGGAAEPLDTDCWWRIVKETATTRFYSDGELLDPELQLTLPAGLYRVQGTLFWRSLNGAGTPAPAFTVTAGATPSVYANASLVTNTIMASYPSGSLNARSLHISVGTRSNYDTAQKGIDMGLVDSHQRSYVDVVLSIASQATVGVKWRQGDSGAAGSYTLDVNSWIAFKKLATT